MASAGESLLPILDFGLKASYIAKENERNQEEIDFKEQQILYQEEMSLLNEQAVKNKVSESEWKEMQRGLFESHFGNLEEGFRERKKAQLAQLRVSTENSYKRAFVEDTVKKIEAQRQLNEITLRQEISDVVHFGDLQSSYSYVQSLLQEDRKRIRSQEKFLDSVYTRSPEVVDLFF